MEPVIRMTMRASNHHNDAFRKEVGTQGIDITGHGQSRAKLSPSDEGGHPPSTEDNRVANHLTRWRHPIQDRHDQPLTTTKTQASRSTTQT
jgi:hypothetical protein